MKKTQISLEELQKRWPKEVAKFLDREISKAQAANKDNAPVKNFLKRIAG